jgi:hypothetical protein
VALEANKPDANLAPKIAKNTLKGFSEVLIFIGKPFYFLLSRAIILAAFLLLITGRLTRNLVGTIFALSWALFHILKKTISLFAKIQLPTLRPPKFRHLVCCF